MGIGWDAHWSWMGLRAHGGCTSKAAPPTIPPLPYLSRPSHLSLCDGGCGCGWGVGGFLSAEEERLSGCDGRFYDVDGMVLEAQDICGHNEWTSRPLPVSPAAAEA